MGGAARNHGGTRGHGCSPLPGERPNFNHHTLSDSKLLVIMKSSKKSEKQTSDQKVKLVKEPHKLKRDRTNETSEVKKSQPVYKETIQSSSSSNLKAKADSKDMAKEANAKKDKSTQKREKPVQQVHHRVDNSHAEEMDNNPQKESNKKANEQMGNKEVQQVINKAPMVMDNKPIPLVVDSHHDEQVEIKHDLETLQNGQSKKVDQVVDTREAQEVDDKLPAVKDNRPDQQINSKHYQQADMKQAAEDDNKSLSPQHVEEKAGQVVDNKYPQDDAIVNTYQFEMPLQVSSVNSQLSHTVLQMLPSSLQPAFSSVHFPVFILVSDLLPMCPLQVPKSPLPLTVSASSQNNSFSAELQNCGPCMGTNHEEMLRIHGGAKD